MLQVVGKRVELSLQDEWGGRTPRTQIVVIGAAGGIDGAFLLDQFQKAVAPNQTLTYLEGSEREIMRSTKRLIVGAIGSPTPRKTTGR